MSKVISSFCLIAFFFLAACTPNITGDGNIVEVDTSYDQVDKIEASGRFELILLQSQTPKIKLKMDQNLAENIVLEQNGSSLKIRENQIVEGFTQYVIYAMIPQAKTLEIKSFVKLETDSKTTYKSDVIDLILHDDAQIQASFDTKELSLEAFENTDVTLMGETHLFDVTASDKAEVNAVDFIAKEVDMDISGTAELKVHATKELDGSASENATIKYVNAGFEKSYKVKDRAEVTEIDLSTK